MPGPLSTPSGWFEDEHWNHSGDHGISGGVRRSGKTRYDKASGKWSNHLANKAERAEENRGGRRKARQS